VPRFIHNTSFLFYRGESSHEISFIEEGSKPGSLRFNPIGYDAKDMHDSGDCLLPGSVFFLAKIGNRQN
jgi:hypothetical protein